MRHFDKCMIPLFLPCMLAAGGCAKIPGGSGTITVSLGTPASAGAISLKDGGTDALPDTEDFILSVCDSKGKAVYEGRFGDSPDELEVPAGSYTVSAASIAFDAPAFGSPCFSDSRVVVVEKGQSIGVRLLCTQSIEDPVKARFFQLFVVHGVQISIEDHLHSVFADEVNVFVHHGFRDAE